MDGLTDEQLPIVRPPDSEVMTYTELRRHFAAWPVWLIDELAYGLAEEEERGYY